MSDTMNVYLNGKYVSNGYGIYVNVKKGNIITIEESHNWAEYRWKYTDYDIASYSRFLRFDAQSRGDFRAEMELDELRVNTPYHNERIKVVGNVDNLGNDANIFFQNFNYSGSYTVYLRSPNMKMNDWAISTY